MNPKMKEKLLESGLLNEMSNLEECDFLQVKLESKNGNLVAFPVSGNGSGDLASLVHADAFIQLPSDKIEFKKGEAFPIIRYRDF